MPGIPVKHIKHMPHRKAFPIVEGEKLTCSPECYCDITLVPWPLFLLSGYTLLSLTSVSLEICGCDLVEGFHQAVHLLQSTWDSLELLPLTD